MSVHLSNLLMIALFGIIYLFAFKWVINRWFTHPDRQSPAFITVRTAALVAASINLYSIADISSDAAFFFLEAGNYRSALFFAAGFFSGMWVFSMLLVALSYLIVGLLTPEKELEQLARNNMELALTHGVILIALAFVISPALVRVANQFIPFPDAPF